MKNRPNKILIVKNRALGDSIIGLGTIAYIRSLFPSAEIIYCVPSWISPMYSKVEIAANRVMAFDLKSPFDWIRYLLLLYRKKFDLIIELHQSGRTRSFFQFLSMFAKVPYIFHNHNLRSGALVIDQGVEKPAIQRDLDGAWSGLHRLKLTGSDIPSFLSYPPHIQLKDISVKDRIVFGVVATRESKMWPLEYFKELAEILLKRDPSLEIYIPLSKSPTDRSIKNRILAMGFPERVKLVQVGLPQLPVVIAESKFYIGNDTGLKHLAVALARPTYTFFGPESPLEWHPYNLIEHKYFYIEEMECRTRSAHFCGIDRCDHLSCQRGTTAEMVVQILKDDSLI